MGETEMKSISTNEDQQKPKFVFPTFPNPFVNFPNPFVNFPNPFLNLPPFKKESKQSSSAEVTIGGRGDEIRVEKSEENVSVSFPVAKKEFPVLKVESEEAGQDGPRNMWQVYALGAFVVLSWAWGKWQESKANNSDKGSGDEEPTSTDD